MSQPAPVRRTRPSIREELEQIVQEFHRVREEHRRNTAPAMRRRFEGQLADHEARFEKIVSEWIASDEVREKWRATFHHGAEPPDTPVARARLLFRGIGQGGDRIVVRDRHDGDSDIFSDGKRLQLLAGNPDPAFDALQGVHFLEIDGRRYREVVNVPTEALDELLESVTNPKAGPPRRFALELEQEGLIDRNYALAGRGKRALVALQATASRR